MRTLLALLLAAALCAGSSAQAAPPLSGGLKKLYLETELVRGKAPAAVVVVPAQGVNRALAQKIVDKIRSGTGVALEVVSDEVSPEALLKRKNVIALGNMSDNRFIEHLYRQWRVILDRTYPGQGGYVVRTLHNPYGTGHNVIFVGASDDAGLAKAADVLLDLLKPRPGKTLSVGWLMKIGLGQGLHPPAIGSFLPKWNVFSWNDSWRKTSTGSEAGYAPATFFGWSPISIAGALYYMTGKREYLDCFKELALPDPGNVPLPNRTDDAFSDPVDPLVKNNHYRSHLVPFIYDLIEESPLFTARERLSITKKLREQQVHYDPKDSYRANNGDRHALWHLMNIYAGSRYFATYYPGPSWERRIANVRSSFRSFINNPTWSDRDTLYWVSTSVEPLFEFFTLDGFDEFVASGTARTMMQGVEILMTGDEIDNGNKFLSMALLHKAAYLTRDSSYTWLARQLGYDYSRFRIGQSFWPAEEKEVSAPDGVVDKIAVFPLARADWQEARTPIAEGDCFQILSYRTGWKKNDDYLLLDGFEGKGRHPYELNTISRLRMFGGKNILEGPESGVSIRHNGMADGMAARGAALVDTLSGPGFALVRTEVPDMPSALWQRNVLTLKDSAAIVIDRVVPRRKGHFDVVRSWQPGSPVRMQGVPARRLSLANGVSVTAAESRYENNGAGVLRENLSRDLEEGQAVTLGTLFAPELKPAAMTPVPGGYLLSGAAVHAFVAAAPGGDKELAFRSDFTYLDRDRLLLARGTSLVLGGAPVVAADKPVTLSWDFRSGALLVNCRTAANLTLATSRGTVRRGVTAGENRFSALEPTVELSDRIGRYLQRLGSSAAKESAPAETVALPQVNWLPRWERDLGEPAVKLAVASIGSDQTIWAVGQGENSAQIVHLDRLGSELGRIARPGELLTLWAAQDGAQAKAFGLLAGFRDDLLYAVAADGRELWRRKTEISPDFRIGERFDAPWFTDPAVISGVSALLVGEFGKKGEQEIVIGRPSTLEFRTLAGDLKARLATRWGTNSALAFLQKPGLLQYGKVLLAGKGFTGNPTVTAVSASHKRISDGYFDGLPPGFADMHAWMQRGLTGMAVADLGATGREQVVFALSGHWNELRVYDGHDNSPLWMKSFGPDKAKGGFMRGLQLLDLDRSGKKAVLVATRPGWLSAFDHHGATIWQRRFASEITVMAGSEELRRVAVGCADGTVYLLDGTGAIMAAGSLDRSVRSLAFGSDFVMVGADNGKLRSYPVLSEVSQP